MKTVVRALGEGVQELQNGGALGDDEGKEAKELICGTRPAK
jgi:hypothetical protein